MWRKKVVKRSNNFFYLYYLIDFVSHETLEDLFLKFSDVNVFVFIFILSKHLKMSVLWFYFYFIDFINSYIETEVLYMMLILFVKFNQQSWNEREGLVLKNHVLQEHLSIKLQKIQYELLNVIKHLSCHCYGESFNIQCFKYVPFEIPILEFKLYCISAIKKKIVICFYSSFTLRSISNRVRQNIKSELLQSYFKSKISLLI